MEKIKLKNTIQKKPRLSKIKHIAVWLSLLFSLQSCNDNAIGSHTFSEANAKEITTKLRDVEQYKELTIKNTILRNAAVINKIMSSEWVQKFIGEDWMKHCSMDVLMPISLIESRWWEIPKWAEWEIWLYHIKPDTWNHMKESYWNNPWRGILNDPSVAGAIYFLKKCAIIEKHIAEWTANPLSQKELLQMAYTLHNTWRDNYFKNKQYDSWSDLEKEYLGMLKRDPKKIDVSDRENRMKEYNENMPENRKSVETQMRFLQLIKPENEVNKLYLPTYRSWFMIGESYEILNKLKHL